ncbi:MAG: pyrroline-5-carboxylate reductase [Gemmatimonadetes bacterium]|nr:pyrroline-5-carboxylate reductase [Gemmatimonadota bacterium]
MAAGGDVRDWTRRVAILGGGNIGQALARGLVAAGYCLAEDITITRRHVELLREFADRGFHVLSDNRAAVRGAHILVLAVQPQQIVGLLDEIRGDLDPEGHLVISVVSGVSVDDIRKHAGAPVHVVRAMPNTAIAIRESMTCLAAKEGSERGLADARGVFDAVGRTVVISEDLMTSATALCACGIAFFLRSIRAASQGGIQIGFHPDESLLLAAQTAKGAASLLLAANSHPESEIDKVTTPRGCTIAGLNEMEHQGFSSALIKGIVVSADKAARLFEGA